VSAMTTTDDPLEKRINTVGRLLPHVEYDISLRSLHAGLDLTLTEQKLLILLTEKGSYLSEQGVNWPCRGIWS
jgi:hypothetical protein